MQQSDSCQLQQQTEDQKTCLPQNMANQEVFSQDQFHSEEKSSEPPSKIGAALTVVLVIKTVVGAGILGLPAVLAQWGWAVPTVLFPLVAALTHITCRMLGECRRLCGHSNYSSLGRETYNNRLFILFIFFCFVLNNTGICIAESQIFGSSIVDILILQGLYQPNAFYTQRWFVSLLLLLLIPIVLLKKIQSLKYFTVIGITAISTFLIMVFVDLAFTNQARGYSPSNTFYAFNPTFNFFKAFSTVPNVLLAFTYQINFFPIFKGLRRPSLQRMANISIIGLCICWFLYYAIAMSGYAAYGSQLMNSNGDPISDYIEVVTALGSNQAIKIVMNVCFVVNAFFTIPVIFFSGRNCLMGLFMVITQYGKVPSIVYYILTTSLFGIIVMVAVSVDSLGAVFNVIGSFSGNFVGNIFPCIFYLVINHRTQKSRGYLYYSSWIILPFSVFLLVFGLASQYIM